MRSFLAILIGYVAWSVLWLLGNQGLAQAWPAQTDAFSDGGALTAPGYLITALILSVLCSVVAGRACAAIARAATARCVWIMAALLLITGVGVQAGVWSRMPTWYHLTFLVLLVPVCVAAGRPRSSAPVSGLAREVA
jgi:hypothetical protein